MKGITFLGADSVAVQNVTQSKGKQTSVFRSSVYQKRSRRLMLCQTQSIFCSYGSERWFPQLQKLLVA